MGPTFVSLLALHGVGWPAVPSAETHGLCNVDARPLLLNPRSPGDMAGQHTFHLKEGDGAVMRIGRGGEVSHLSSKLSSTGARRDGLSLLGLRQTVPVLHAHRTRCCCHNAATGRPAFARGWRAGCRPPTWQALAVPTGRGWSGVEVKKKCRVIA